MRLALLLIVASACAADLELGEPEVSAVCLDDATLSFAGSGTDRARATLDLAPLDLEAPDDQRVTLSWASLSAASGVTSMDFVVRARLSLLDTAAGDLSLADTTVAGGVLELAGDPAVDLAVHLRDGASRIAIELDGNVPAARWSANADLCFDLD